MRSASFSTQGELPALRQRNDGFGDGLVIERVVGVVAFARQASIRANPQAEDNVLQRVQFVRAEADARAQTQICNLDDVHAAQCSTNWR